MHGHNEGPGMTRFAPSQWETALLCNDVSHWLGVRLESAVKAISHLWSSLVWVIACCLLLPSHYLNYWWFMIKSILKNKLNFNPNTDISCQENAFQNIICKCIAIMSRDEYVNQQQLQMNNCVITTMVTDALLGTVLDHVSYKKLTFRDINNGN